MVKNSENPETIVSSSMRIEGELKSNGDITIDGIVTGKVHTSRDLIVGSNAEIDADVLAANATVAGIIRGNVTIKGILVVLETGKIIGDINCASLGVKEGAYFSGACKMAEPKRPTVEPST